jgi:hypothetical protein
VREAARRRASRIAAAQRPSQMDTARILRNRLAQGRGRCVRQASRPGEAQHYRKPRARKQLGPSCPGTTRRFLGAGAGARRRGLGEGRGPGGRRVRLFGGGHGPFGRKVRWARGLRQAKAVSTPCFFGQKRTRLRPPGPVDPSGLKLRAKCRTPPLFLAKGGERFAGKPCPQTVQPGRDGRAAAECGNAPGGATGFRWWPVGKRS